MVPITLASVEPLISTSMLGTNSIFRPGVFTLGLVFALSASAQEPIGGSAQPGEVLTASQGVYPEVFAKDTIRKIGSFLFNTRTKRVCRIGVNDRDTVLFRAIGTRSATGSTMTESRIARWLSMDPLAFKVPDSSPYSFVINSPIMFVDYEGKIFRIYYELQNTETGKTTLTYADFNGTTAITENGQAYTIGANKFVDDVITSYHYITDNGADIDGALQFVAESKKVTSVKLVRKLSATLYDGSGNINFNPLEGLYTYDGFQSPAVGFFHESYHRYLELKGRKFNTTDDEEQYVLHHAETPAVGKLREAGFKQEGSSEYGTGYIEKFAKGPTSTEPAKSKKEAKTSLKTRNVSIQF
jgi:hypothetical protein